MLWHDRDLDLPDERFIPREHLGAARGAVYGLGITGLFCAVLPVLGYLAACLRWP